MIYVVARVISSAHKKVGYVWEILMSIQLFAFILTNYLCLVNLLAIDPSLANFNIL